MLAGALLGYLGGSAAGDLLLGHPPLHAVHQYSQAATGFLLISLASAAFGAYFFTSREQLARPWLAHAQAQRQASEARLMLLQSQLEPHMLFNTLAKLRALLGRDPQRACDMLDHLVAYLRATLSASRTDLHPLQTEFSRLRDYLALMAVRMGPRLQVTLDLPEALAALPVPPLLLQPLVENALVLGLEPKVQGGHMTVPAQYQDGQLTLTVSDIGLGLGPGANPPEGFGLTQVRKRLQTIFGAFGRHEMIANYAGGTAATVVFLCKMK